MYPSYLQLGLFAAAWAFAIYCINCAVARGIKRIDPMQAVLHTTSMAMLGLTAEIIIGSIYKYLFGKPLWNYTTLSIHHAYTSKYALLLWGIYGFHLYLLHGTLHKQKTRSIHRLALLFCFEAILIEGIVNLTYRLAFGKYIYYYFPSDLWHLTSIQALPAYLVGGYVVLLTFKNFEPNPWFFTFISVSVAGVLAFLT